MSATKESHNNGLAYSRTKVERCADYGSERELAEIKRVSQANLTLIILIFVILVLYVLFFVGLLYVIVIEVGRVEEQFEKQVNKLGKQLDEIIADLNQAIASLPSDTNA